MAKRKLSEDQKLLIKLRATNDQVGGAMRDYMRIFFADPNIAIPMSESLRDTCKTLMLQIDEKKTETIIPGIIGALALTKFCEVGEEILSCSSSL